MSQAAGKLTGLAGREIRKSWAASRGLALRVAGIPPGMALRYQSTKKAPTWVGAFHTTGAGNRSRTCDLRITNAPLYQLSYSG